MFLIESLVVHNFNIVKASYLSNTWGEPYNYNSIMHYGPMAFAKEKKDKSKPTLMIRKPEADPFKAKHLYDGKLGQRLSITMSDARKIDKMFNCDEKAKSAPTGKKMATCIKSKTPSFLARFWKGIKAAVKI